MSNNIKWDCPICDHEFKENEIIELKDKILKKIEYLSSPLETDIPITKNRLFHDILINIRYILYRLRPSSNMMDAQNEVGNDK
jgi:hypothetical protein